MRKTKIVCTLGPSTDKEGILEQLIEEGMDVARFNFSHGDHDTHKKRFEQVVKLREKHGRPVATMIDTKGPEIRVGMLDTESGKINLKEGDILLFVPENDYPVSDEGVDYVCLLYTSPSPRDA